MDFTLTVYKSLLTSFQSAGYSFYTFEQYMSVDEPAEKMLILRHDVDAKAANALRMANIEKELGIRASYYFRIVPKSNQPEIIKQIAALGHEIGYHYEDLTLSDGDMQKGIHLFKQHLGYFRSFYPIQTICMHGSPRSPHDSRDLWNVFKYKDFGLIGEPYFDVDYKKVFYITDTGRAWDGDKFNVRDKVDSDFELRFHSTKEIIKAIENHTLPHHCMINTHPHRWTQGLYEWLYEYITQNAKNVIKRIIVKNQKKS
jgi:hypothetical protein